MVTKTNEQNYEAPVMQEAQMTFGGARVLCSSGEAEMQATTQSLGAWE